jgi:hypothetical protein
MWKYLLACVLVLTAAQASACEVTRDQYNSLRSGMSYSQIVSILGCRGSEQMSIGTGDSTSTNYVWQGAGGGSVLVTVSDGRLFMKMQSGLSERLERAERAEEPSQYLGCYTSNGGKCPEEKGFRCSVLGKCD